MLNLWHLDELLKSHRYGRMHDQQILQKQKAGYKKIHANKQCKSLLKKHLTKEAFSICSTRKTFKGSTFLDVIQSGIKAPYSEVGVYAPDPDCYRVFSDFFDPLIQDYHKCSSQIETQPQMNFDHVNSIVDLDPTGEYVMSVRVRCVRNLSDFAFNSLITEDDYLRIEKMVEEALKDLEGELKGTYYSLSSIDASRQQKLISSHCLFKEGDQFLEAANGYRYWPTGRGVFHNEVINFIVWVNEEDHLRIFAMQDGGNLRAVYQRLSDAMTFIEKKLQFERDDRLGYLTFCPTNLGAGIKTSVHIDLPKLGKDRNRMKDIASSYNLQLKDSRRERKEADQIIYEVFNKSRLGMTEYEAVNELQSGILDMIKEEKNLS